MAGSATCSHVRAYRPCTPLSKPSFAPGRQPSILQCKSGLSPRLKYPASTVGLHRDVKKSSHASQLRQSARPSRYIVCNASNGGNGANPVSHPSATWPTPEAGTLEQGGFFSKWRSWCGSTPQTPPYTQIQNMIVTAYCKVAPFCPDYLPVMTVYCRQHNVPKAGACPTLMVDRSAALFSPSPLPTGCLSRFLLIGQLPPVVCQS